MMNGALPLPNDRPEPVPLTEEEQRLKKKHSLEAAVTVGLGYGKKKKHAVEAFYTAIWPVLEGAGWKLVKGEGEDEGAKYFVPPGISMGKKGEQNESPAQDDASQSSPISKETPETPTPASPSKSSDEGPWECSNCGHTNSGTNQRCTGKTAIARCMAWRGGKRLKKQYFSKLRDVIQRVLEKKSEAEEKAATAYLELVPDAPDLFVDKDKKPKAETPKEEGKKIEPTSPQKERVKTPPPEEEDQNTETDASSPSKNTRKSINSVSHSAWKYETTHFEKSCSRVGPEYHVSVLPVAGSYTSPTTPNTDSYDGGALYERVWDPEEAEKLGKLDFVDTRVGFTHKSAAYDMFHSRGYRLPGFYHEVSSLSPTDCSDWTKQDKDHFRSAVFEFHEDMKEVSKAIGKPQSECVTYYIVKFRKTKSYKSLKRSMKRKANVSEGNAGTLVCNECGKGGMLIACDTCEAHYHLGCATPVLAAIPDGTWNCGNCRRDTRSMISSQDEMSCKSDQPAEASVDTSVEAAPGEVASKESDIINDGSTDGAENGNKRKIEAVTGSSQDEREPKPEEKEAEAKEAPVQKKIKLDGTKVTAATGTSEA